ncbi:MAG: GntR family transcriptional regulator [Anaerovorax sp.]
MDIIIGNSSGKPIYEQITNQIKGLILKETLAPGDALPSMRLLAKELRISVITTKRAYEELEREGFIETIPGKGSFVAKKNLEFMREEQLRIIEDYLEKAVCKAKSTGIPYEELAKILQLLY